MDIIRQYFGLIENKVEEAFEKQRPALERIAEIFGECMDSQGVVQLFGVRHGEEFVNELNYRAGGLAPFHALRLKELMLNGLIAQEDIDSGAVYEDRETADLFAKIYDLDDRDMYCLVSFYGNEPLILELAKRAKEKGQKVVGVVNRKSYDACHSTLLDYCDAWLDMSAEEEDIALRLDKTEIGQISSTVSNCLAQMLTAQLYSYFNKQGRQAPVLLSANVKGADVHNNSLTDPYGRRIR